MANTVKKNIPALRFPGLKGEWEEKKLGNVGKFIGGGTPSTKKLEYWKGTIPWISSSDLKENDIDNINITRWITKDAIEKSATKLIPQNSILIVSRVGVGKIAVTNSELCTSQDFSNLIPFKDNPRFLAYTLSNAIGKLLSFNQGTSIKGFVKADLEELSVILPSSNEQQKIASFLSAVDERLQQLQQQQTLLEQYKKGCMQQLFSQKMRFKDEHGKDYADWEEKELGNIGNTYNGLTGKTKENFGKGKPYIQYKQVFDDTRINISRFDYVEIGKKEKQNTVKYGDILFTVSSETPEEVGMSSVLLDYVSEVYLNSFCFGYRPNSLHELSPQFAQYLFRTKAIRRKIQKLAQGSTRYNMSKNQLMKITILLPCLEEQTKIAHFLSAIDEQINTVKQQVTQTQQFKKGLLQQMFV